MSFLINIPYYIWMIAIGTSLLVAVSSYYLYVSLKKSDPKQLHEDRIAELMMDDFIEEGETKVGIVYRWNFYWNDRFKSLGIGKNTDEKGRAGRDVIILWIVAAILTYLFTRIIFVAIAVPSVILYLIGAISKNMSNKVESQINDQLPGFLFAMKANVQANQTPEQSVMKVVDNIPSPLYEELVILKNRLLANGSFTEALEEVKNTTKSRDLRFLCSCMVQAANSGANMEDQLTTIQKVLESRRKVTDEIDKAVRQASPAMWLASIVIPLSFVFTILFDHSAQKFWFVDPMSYIVMIIVAILWAAGIWLSKKLTDSIRNL